ncbi:hypothetical protein IKE72_00160 [Candidatus Saccharibacteria bacterium]|nr:hypothetical protein [Candidatus Saccharibacteria bacterium]
MPKNKEFDFFRENTGDDATFEQFNDDWTPEDGYRYPREVDQPRGDKANKAAEDAKRELSYQAATAAASELEATDEAAEEDNDYNVDPFATWDGDKNADSGITEDDLANMSTEKLLELYQKYLAAEARVEAGKEAEKSYNQSPLSPEKAARARKTREKVEKKKRAKGHIKRYIAAGVAATIATLSLIGANVTSKKDAKQNEPRNAYTNTVKTGGADEALAAQGVAYDSYDDYAAKTGKQNTVNTPATTTAETVRSQTSVAPSSETIPASGTTAESYARNAGEAMNGATYNYNEYLDRENKESYNAFGYDRSFIYEEKNDAVTANEIMNMAKKGPEYLATYVYDIFSESEKADFGIEGMSPTQIDDRISTMANGGAFQKALENKLSAILNDANTDYNYYLENDTETTYYLYFVDENKDGVASPEEMHIAQDVKKRNNAPQVDVSRYLDGGWTIVGDYNLECGIQGNYTEEVANVPFISSVTENHTETETETNRRQTETETESETSTETETETSTETETETSTETETETTTTETETETTTETEPDNPIPVVETETPTPNKPTPETPTPETPTPETPTPETPVPETETPAPETETPAPETETPAPETETPAPETETPAPETETPAPETETPSPETETPTPETETPAPETETPTPESEYEGKGENPHAGNPEEHEQLGTTVNSEGDQEVEQTAGNTAAQSNPGEEVTNNTIEEARGDSEAAPGSAAIAENQGVTDESGEAVVDSTSGEQVVIENGAGMAEQPTAEEAQAAAEQAIQDNNEGVASTFDAYETNEDHPEAVQADNANVYEEATVPEDTGNGAGEGSQDVEGLLDLINGGGI